MNTLRPTSGSCVQSFDRGVQIEFPSILLPDGIKSGSIVDISVSRNRAAEAGKEKDFRELQESIWETYGRRTPQAPVLRCRNTTQTAVVLEWDPLELATAKIRSLSIYRNGEKMGNIPNPLSMTSTKISGLAIDRDYTFQLELRTSSGLHKSELLRVHTHKMTELGGITVTPGVLPAEQREALIKAVDRIGGRVADTVRLDTTHFVCTEGRGREWERAKEMNVPIVRPEWVEGCEREGRMVGVKDYYLDANPKLRPMPQLTRQTSQSSTAQSQATQLSSQRSQEQVSQPPTPRVAAGVSAAGGSAGAAAAAAAAPREERRKEEEDQESETSSTERSGHEPEDERATNNYAPASASPRQSSEGDHSGEEDDEGGDPGNFEEVAL